MFNLSGQSIKGYEIRDLIGLGGFGGVYRAYQTVVDREVAIKVILPQYANQPQFIRNFEYEAKLVARLEHVYIVPLYDFWRDPTGAYIVMRLLKGGSLQEKIKREGPLSPEEAMRILDQISQALATAHRHGIVHQDIKTANILLDEDGNAFLSDFGIAKDLQRPREEQPESEAGETVLHGSPEYMAPEQILRAGSDARTDIYSLGIVLFELLTGKKPFVSSNDEELIRKQLYDKIPRVQEFRPELSEALNVVIQRATDKAPRQRYASPIMMAENFRQFVELAKRDGGQAPSAQEVIEKQPVREISLEELVLFDPPNPYKGLRAFQEADAADFFGRETLIEKLYQRIRNDNAQQETRFLAVVGPSGSGKSSVVRAGLLPRLRKHSADWYIVAMTPGTNPMHELEAVLMSAAQDETIPFTALLGEDYTGLHRAIGKALGDFFSELVLFIDQFEEVFTLVSEESIREHLLDNLVYALMNPQSRLRLIVTLRADFYHKPLEYESIGRLLQARTEVVLPMNVDELRDAIVKPAERVGLKLEDGLIAEILADVHHQPGTLPLLQFTLTELFTSRKRDTLTLQAYRSSGGVSGTMTRRADEILHTLTPANKEAARQMFLRLITLGEGSEDTRRRAKLSELLSIEGDSRLIQNVIDLFGKRRLLAFNNEAESRMPTVEIAHEALIREWEILREWVNDNRNQLRLQRQLQVATAEWQKAKKDQDSYLLRGGRLAQFEVLVKSKQISLSHDEISYLNASILRRQRASQIRGVIFAAVLVAAILGLSLAIFAFDREGRAIYNGNLARSRELSIKALTNSSDFDLTALLSETALRVADTYDARSALLKVMQLGYSSTAHIEAFLHSDGADMRAVAVSPDGSRFITGDTRGVIRVWDSTTYAPIGEPIAAHAGSINDIVISADGSTLYTSSDDDSIAIIVLETGEIRRLNGHTETIGMIALSPDGQQLASASSDGSVRLWDLNSGEGQVLGEFDANMYAVAFSPDGQTLAVGGDDSLITLLDVATGQPKGEPLQGHTGWIRALTFNTSGALLISGSNDTTIRLWRTASGAPIGNPIDVHDQGVRDLQLIGDVMILSGSEDGRAALINISEGRLIDLLPNFNNRSISSVAALPDQSKILVAGAARAAVIWDMNGPNRLADSMMLETSEVLAQQLTTSDELITVALMPNADGLLVQRRPMNNLTQITELTINTGETRNFSVYAISPDGNLLAVGSLRGDIQLFDLTSGEAASVISAASRGAIFSLAFSRDGQMLASGDQSDNLDGGFRIFHRTESGWESRLDRIIAHQDRISALAFSPDGSILATGGRDAQVRLWSVERGEAITEHLQGHSDTIVTVAFSDDGRWMASGGRDNLIMLWDVQSRSLASRLSGHVNWVTQIAFSPNGEYLASGGRDQSMILWDMRSQRPAMLGDPFVHAGAINGIHFNSDSTSVYVTAAVSNNTGVTQLTRWQVNIAQWQQMACQLANRQYTAEERSTYLEGLDWVTVCSENS